MFRHTQVLVLAAALAACGTPEADERRVPADGAAADARQAPAKPATSDAPGAGAAYADDGGTLPEGRASRVAPEGGDAPARERSSAGPGAAGAPDPTGAAPLDAPAGDPQSILRRAERRYAGIRSMEAGFSQVVTIPLLEQTQRSRGKMYHRRPDRFLMRFTEPRGDVVVADGRYLWMYYPSVDAKQVMRSSLAQGGQSADLHREFLSNTAERFTARLVGSEQVGGRTADVLVLTPRQPAPYRRVRIWVDREDSLVRRFEVHEENESVRLIELSDLRPNAAVDDDLFSFTPPPGAQVFEP